MIEKSAFRRRATGKSTNPALWFLTNMVNSTSNDLKSKRVAVGMSGGLDSSVTAALLVDSGCEVIGVTAHLWREGSRCCSLEDVTRAQRVAEFLGIRHYVTDSIPFFAKRIVQPFVMEYAVGRTPSPCILCNQLVKFGVLLKDVMEMGCTHIATGHYARLLKKDDAWHLLRGKDRIKDQSYFLHRLYQEQLEHILFPLGEWTKPEAVEYARKRGLPVKFNAESQDLCFVPEDGGYVFFLEKHRPQLKKSGPIVDIAGREIGRHEGIHRYTIGQRAGIRVASSTRLYVKEIRADSNTIVVGPLEDIVSRGCLIEDVHWIQRSSPADGARLSVRLRYRHKGVSSAIQRIDGDRVKTVFDEPQFAVTPGQAAVFYADDEVLGGGWIKEGIYADA